MSENEITDGEAFDFSQQKGKESKILVKSQPIPRVKILARKFDDLENSYYYQLHGFYSISEMEELLMEHKINISKLSFDWDKDKATLNYVRITKNGLTQSLNQLFADKWDEFTKICTEKHFPLYQDVLTDKFSFNFTAEEMTAWLTTYPMTIFRNFEYNRSAHAITPKVNNADHFEIDRTVRSKIENLFNSSLNIQEKKFKEFKPKMDTALLTFSENFEMQQEGINIKQNSGWIDDVLIIGRKYIESHPGSSVNENTSYWMDSLKSIFTINENDYFSLVSFVMDSIKVRLHGSSQSMRVMVITGDSGIGKDSFLQGLLTGLNYQKAIKVILRGALKGVTGFSSAKEKTLKSVMYNYVSDDLSAANASTNLDTITATELPCENKGKDQKMIPKRFNSVITNNAKKVIFGKDKDPNAIARRFNCCDIKYAKGCLASDYKIFFRHYDGKFDEYWAGFFTYCFELSYFKAESDKLAIMASNYTLDNIHELIYQGNDDSRILDLFTGFYNREIEKMNVNILDYERSLTFDTRFKNEFIKGIKGKYILIIKSISDFWKIDNKFSADTIKKTISAHVKGAKFNSTYKDDRVSKHAAISIPCEYFTKESEPDNFEDGFAQIKTDLIENFKKYL